MKTTITFEKEKNVILYNCNIYDALHALQNVDPTMTKCIWFINTYETYSGVEGLVRTYLLEHPYDVDVRIVNVINNDSYDELSLLEQLSQQNKTNVEFKIINNECYTRKIAPMISHLNQPNPLDRNGVYVVTGGTGSLGTLCGEILMELQIPPTNIVLLSRKNTNTLSSGMIVHKCDVTKEEDVDDLVKQYPNIHGVIHCAGTLQDTMVVTMTPEDLDATFKVKQTGAELILEKIKGLQVCILFSSLAACLGNVGQGNYAAANSSMDSIGEARNDIPKLMSVQWGPWDMNGSGMAGSDIVAKAHKTGIGAITRDQGKEIIKFILEQDHLPSTMMISPMDWPQYLSNVSFKNESTSWFQVESESKEQTNDLNNQTNSLQSLDEIKQIVKSLVKESTDLDIGETEALMEAGMDSLSSVEFKNKLIKQFKHNFKSSLVFNYPTINDVSKYIVNVLEKQIQPHTQKQLTSNDIKQIVKSLVKESTDLDIGDSEALMEAGMDSLSSVEFKNKLIKQFKHNFKSSLVFNYPTIIDIANYISTIVNKNNKAQSSTTKHPHLPNDYECDFKSFQPTLKRKNVGSIQWLTNVDFSNIPDISTIITIEPKKINLDSANKELNKPAMVSFYGYLDKKYRTMDLKKQEAIEKNIKKQLSAQKKMFINLNFTNGDMAFVVHDFN